MTITVRRPRRLGRIAPLAMLPVGLAIGAALFAALDLAGRVFGW